MSAYPQQKKFWLRFIIWMNMYEWKLVMGLSIKASGKITSFDRTATEIGENWKMCTREVNN